MQKSQDRRTDFEVHQLTNLLKNQKFFASKDLNQSDIKEIAQNL